MGNAKLRKALALLMSLALMLCLAACGGSTSEEGVSSDTGEAKTNSTSSISKDKIQIELATIAKNGDAVFKITNNNDSVAYIADVTANFKDSNGNFALSESFDMPNFVIPANGYVYNMVYKTDQDFSQYPDVSFTFDVQDPVDYTFGESVVTSGLDISSQDTGSQIAVTVKNNTGKTISHVWICATYFQGDEIVGVTVTSNDPTTPADGEAYINAEYPQNSNFDNISFDRYEVCYLMAAFEAEE